MNGILECSGRLCLRPVSCARGGSSVELVYDCTLPRTVSTPFVIVTAGKSCEHLHLHNTRAAPFFRHALVPSIRASNPNPLVQISTISTKIAITAATYAIVQKSATPIFCNVDVDLQQRLLASPPLTSWLTCNPLPFIIYDTSQDFTQQRATSPSSLLISDHHQLSRIDKRQRELQ